MKIRAWGLYWYYQAPSFWCIDMAKVKGSRNRSALNLRGSTVRLASLLSAL